MKILHMADVHLGAVPAGAKGETNPERLLWDAFEETLAAAESRQVDLVLIAGDLFHRQPLKRDLKEVNYLFSKLTHAKVVLCAGNHDYLSKNSAYRNFQWNENVTFFGGQKPESVFFPDLSATVYGLSYEAREIREPLYENIEKNPRPGYHILLAHGGDESHIPIRTARLELAGFDYVAMGHIHIPSQIKENRMVMAGSLQPLDETETGPHGYWLVECKKNTTVAFCPVRKLEYRELTIGLEGRETGRAILDRVARELEDREPYQRFHLHFTGEADPDLELPVEQLEELPGVVSVTEAYQRKLSLDRLSREHQGKAVAYYIQRLEGSEDPVQRRALELGLHALLGNTHVH